MKIFNSQADSASDAASVIGKEINLAISDAVDSAMGYSVKRED